MKVRARIIEDEHGLYITCGNCGNRLATLLSNGRNVDEPVPYACPLCGAVVDRSSGDNDTQVQAEPEKQTEVVPVKPEQKQKKTSGTKRKKK